MPEFPDIEVYVDSLRNTTVSRPLIDLRVGNPFLVRSVEPSIAAVVGQIVTSVRRIGKRIAFKFDNDHWVVVHLMIAGRFQWKSKPPSLAAKQMLAAFDFAHGSLLLTEAGTKKRASLYVVADQQGLAAHDPGGLEVFDCTAVQFRETLLRENHTLKRSLTDPRLFSGIGNAYSDEILHKARLSPVRLTQRLGEEEIEDLFIATKETLSTWREKLLVEASGKIPQKVTAFRPEMSVHGKFGMPCPVCAAPIQRIRYKNNETNYCAQCQNEGRLLKDRSLSRLLKQDWPKTLDDM